MSPTRRSAVGLWVGIVGVLLLAGGGGILLATPRQKGDAPAAAAPVASSVVAAVGGPKGLYPDAAGRLRVRIADREPARLPSDGVPPGWTLQEFVGHAAIELVRSDGRLAARLHSERASFAIHRDVVVELREFPYLSWTWKVIRLPAGGDVREAARDDQAAQLYVIFPRWPSPRTASDVIGYVWDSRAPAGTRIKHPRADNVRVVVVESGPARLGEWRTYERNVAADYTALFGRQPPRVGKVAVMVDSNDTRGEAEALFGDLIFARTPQGRTEIPTPVLR
ncbi:MAG: hypothetical protein DME02_16475 [Candidatus Rokuibacteriota bacterium]|nr:MAG: hypothetical protein DME02_16475 [Candidatus Rokubacteria bacterium]